MSRTSQVKEGSTAGIAMPNLSLTLACGPYAHTDALMRDIVRVEGIDLTFLPLASPVEIFTRMFNHEFDASEMSLSYYIRHRPAGVGRASSTGRASSAPTEGEPFPLSPSPSFRCASSATASSSSTRTRACAGRKI